MEYFVIYLDAGIVLLVAIILQFFISNHSTWSKVKKLNVSISLALLLFILNTSFFIITLFLPNPISGIILFIIISWTFAISLLAGALQIITSIVVWLFKKNIVNKNR